MSARGAVPDAGYEKGFLGPSVEAFGFLVCKKGRSCFSCCNRRARFCDVAHFLITSFIFSALGCHIFSVAKAWRSGRRYKNLNQGGVRGFGVQNF